MPLPFTGGGGLILLEDTRNQKGKHKNIEDYCRRTGIQIVRKCLSVGDYMLSEDGVNPIGDISVDTKMDLLELSKDIMSNDHRRFRQECIRAKDMSIQLVILVEEYPPYGKVDLWEVPKWQSSNKWHRYGDPMTLVDPRALRKAMITMMVKYGVQFQFCTRRQSPARVIKILKGEAK